VPSATTCIEALWWVSRPPTAAHTSRRAASLLLSSRA
jgi:hypothetical protein